MAASGQGGVGALERERENKWIGTDDEQKKTYVNDVSERSHVGGSRSLETKQSIDSDR